MLCLRHFSQFNNQLFQRAHVGAEGVAPPQQPGGGLGDIVGQRVHLYPLMAGQQGEHRMRDHRQPGAAGHAGQHRVVGLDLHHLTGLRAIAFVPGFQPQSVGAAGTEGEQRLSARVLRAVDIGMVKAGNHHHMFGEGDAAVEFVMLERAVHQRRRQGAGAHALGNLPGGVGDQRQET